MQSSCVNRRPARALVRLAYVCTQSKSTENWMARSSCQVVIIIIMYTCETIPVLVTCTADAVTWTPRIPKMMKNVQQIRTMFPIGRSDDSSVWTTSFSPGARLITLPLHTGIHPGQVEFCLKDEGKGVSFVHNCYFIFASCYAAAFGE